MVWPKPAWFTMASCGVMVPGPERVLQNHRPAFQRGRFGGRCQLVGCDGEQRGDDGGQAPPVVRPTRTSRPGERNPGRGVVDIMDVTPGPAAKGAVRAVVSGRNEERVPA
ncbi:hypothetical protein GCM10017557_03660 [Streptomyces aurantiacus]|uniref:Uncharacterized protein n=1 Tax=Streptomyces aurantiacus TaxID=47760 RepID=A0A7G1NV82_9ACTN|nr:hypothetical protein GCM10017557_03660 [Streptomyces aurantiacus]